MTLKELSQLYHLNREIEIDQERLAELEYQARSPAAANLTGDKVQGGKQESRLERYVLEAADLRAIIEAKQLQCIHERNRLERWISDIPDSLLRMIFTLRFINGLSWYQVSVHIGGGNTEASVKMACYRFLNDYNKKNCEN